MTTAIYCVEPVENYATRATRIAFELLAQGKNLWIVGDTFTYRQLLDLKPRLWTVVDEGGKIRVLLWPSAATVSSHAVERLLEVENTEVFFLPGPPAVPGTSFVIDRGDGWTVLAASGRDLYGAEQDQGAIMATHPTPAQDPAALR